MSELSLPRACAGCGNPNADQLKGYNVSAKGSHTEHYGTLKQTTTYSVRTEAYLCKDCKRTARSRLFRSWLRGGLPLGLLILTAFLFYPLLAQNWWLYYLLWKDAGFSAIASLVAIGFGFVFIFGGISNVLFHPYTWFFRVVVMAGQFGGSTKLKLRDQRYAQLVRRISPSLWIELIGSDLPKDLEMSVTPPADMKEMMRSGPRHCRRCSFTGTKTEVLTHALEVHSDQMTPEEREGMRRALGLS